MRRAVRSLLLVVVPLALGPPARCQPAGDSRGAVVHYLPFPAGTTCDVAQGNDQDPSHRDGYNKYAFDFWMPVGSAVCATADGKVTFVKENGKGPTGRWEDNNLIVLRYVDGTVGVYAHLEENGAIVAVDDEVKAGEVIGRSGNTGSSAGPHLHFGLHERSRSGASIPCHFQDVPRGGVPTRGDRVTSMNASIRLLLRAIADLETLYDRAAALDARQALRRVLNDLPKKPPTAVALALEKAAGRDDFRKAYEARRDALLERHAAEARRMLERLTTACENGPPAEALYLATVVKKEFALRDAGRGIDSRLAELRAREDHGAVVKEIESRLTFRTMVVRALESDLRTRDKEDRGRKVDWKTVLAAYRRALEAAPEGGESAGVLRALMQAVTARMSR